MINTVETIKTYTAEDYSDACKAQPIKDTIGRPSTRYYIYYVERCLLLNCPITKADILRTKDTLGPNLGSLKGKTTHKSNT